jgi:hypothetical protein
METILTRINKLKVTCLARVDHARISKKWTGDRPASANSNNEK